MGHRQDGGVLLFVGIAALGLFGFVVLIIALAYDPPIKPDSPRDPARAREPRQQRKPLRRQVPHAQSAQRPPARALVTLRTRAAALVDEWGLRLRDHARESQVGWLEPTILIAVMVGSVVAAWLIVMLG